MSTLPERLEASCIPRIRNGADVLGADLQPNEAFLLFRVDGRATIAQLATLAGIEEEEARELIARLASVGLLEVELASGERPREAPPSPLPTEPEGPTPLSRIVEEVGGAYDPGELYEDVQIPIPRRKQILDAFYTFEKLDHYEVLGIDDSADKKAVKSAYFALSKTFHTDTLYGKELGTYKQKMDVVFKRITQAYNVLSKPAMREEYDAYLRSVKGTRAARAAIDAALGIGGPQAPPISATPKPAPAKPSPPPVRPAAPPPAAAPPSSEEARRRARELYARKLSSTRNAPTRPPPSGAPSMPPAQAPTPPPPRDASQVARDLQRALVSVSQHTGGVSQARRLAQDAKRAEEKGDLVTAANAFRLAKELEPDDREVDAGLQRVSAALRVQMLPEFEKQAAYEERNGDHAAAAISWQRVAAGKPDDPISHGAAARCLRRSGGELKLQQQLARRASELAPNDVELRVLLGQIYLEAEMPLNARRELDAAAKLDPNDETVKKLLAELKQKLR
ncbi:MAG: DnaJ domain-containing protein [Deltaproteobacteria bacterium]|nr:DnaJ domain-containing protein [Deltaproteobacteria bacterium]